MQGEPLALFERMIHCYVRALLHTSAQPAQTLVLIRTFASVVGRMAIVADAMEPCGEALAVLSKIAILAATHAAGPDVAEAATQLPTAKGAHTALVNFAAGVAP